MAGAQPTTKTELFCPSCLYYLNNPVTINCGHNFCDHCIHMSWVDQEDMFPCPVCFLPCSKMNLRVNTGLGSSVEKMCYRLEKLIRKAKAEERGSEENNSVPSCPEKRPVGEVTADDRQMISDYTEFLEKHVSEMKTLISIQNGRLQQLASEKTSMDTRLMTEFGTLSEFLCQEREAAMSRNEEERADVERKLDINIIALKKYRSTLVDLQKEVAERSVMSDEMLLREVKGVMQRLESLTLPALHPIRFSQRGLHKGEFHIPIMQSLGRRIVQKFREVVTLDPRTAPPSLCVSEDGKSVHYVGKESKEDGEVSEPDDGAVLGSKGYSSGRHYWEVQVGDKPEWAVGVCSDAPSRQGQQPLAGQKALWTIQLQGGNYRAGGAVPVHLSLKRKPTKIGIFLDCDLGQIFFFDASCSSEINHLEGKFNDELKPYFWVGRDASPLTLCEA